MSTTNVRMLQQVYDKGPSPYKSLITAFRTIVKDEGARALYQVAYHSLFIRTLAHNLS